MTDRLVPPFTPEEIAELTEAGTGEKLVTCTQREWLRLRDVAEDHARLVGLVDQMLRLGDEQKACVVKRTGDPVMPVVISVDRYLGTDEQIACDNEALRAQLEQFKRMISCEETGETAEPTCAPEDPDENTLAHRCLLCQIAKLNREKDAMSAQLAEAKRETDTLTEDLRVANVCCTKALRDRDTANTDLIAALDDYEVK